MFKINISFCIRILKQVIILSILGLVALGILLATYIYFKASIKQIPQDTKGKRIANGELIFKPIKKHVHSSSIIGLKDKIISVWFEGGGERRADDVKIMGSFKKHNSLIWEKPFVVADTVGFPDLNPVIFLDKYKKLWLIYYTPLSNQSYSSLLNYKISSDYKDLKNIKWEKQGIILPKFAYGGNGLSANDKFTLSYNKKAKEYGKYLKGIYSKEKKISFFRGDKIITINLNATLLYIMSFLWNTFSFYASNIIDGSLMPTFNMAFGDNLGHTLFRRLGWQSKNKALITNNNTIIIPLYSDLMNLSMMAITKDGGDNWTFSEPIVGNSAIAPALAHNTKDNEIIAFMRNNGPSPNKVHMSKSYNNGLTWSNVKYSTLPNIQSSMDTLRVNSTTLLAAFNDKTHGGIRNSLKVSISKDNGKSWREGRFVAYSPSLKELFSYPSLSLGENGNILLTYSYIDKRKKGKKQSIKFFEFPLFWAQDNDTKHRK